MSNFEENDSMGAVAIIGMTGRFPGADDMESFWNNLYNGVESVRFFSHDELIKMGIDEHLLGNPRFVAADAILDGMDLFDAAFFDYSAREAEIMDPQHRLFLESAWEVLESAGYNSDLYDGRISVYAGPNLSGYMVRNLYSNPGLVENVGSFKIMLANGQDFLATKVSYKMNLMGPSVNVNTLCSSSLVAVHYACQNLLNYGCDIAMAGGVSFQVSRNEAFFYQEGGIGSSDGHCRAYDSKANGTVSGSGLAVVVLKRLEDAIADGDHIHAVIRGTGINNDGSNKNSYTAPNVDGQAECIAEAIVMSGVNPETITYIDGHGTGTDLGDPIEIAALTKAFRAYTDKKQFCAIGSVKTNIGHLVNAGGLASVIKTVLAMQHRVIPPSLNFEEPNPKIEFVNTPFYVNSKLSKWETDGFPLRAGVSSFGIGGTNTHVVLEEAPALEPSEESGRPFKLITLSAKTGTALDKMTENLLEHVKKNKSLRLEDVAFTLQVGRRNFNHRRMMVCRDMDDLISKLEAPGQEQVISRFQKPKEQPVVFVFPGEGCGYPNMGAELYEKEEQFRNATDYCSQVLKQMTGADVRGMLYPKKYGKDRDLIDIPDQRWERALLFITEYALARLWMSWGIEPQCMLGEGIGEYIAACLSGVMSIEDALKLAVCRDENLPEAASGLSLGKCKIPFISNVTGSWITDFDAASQSYWVRQRRGLHFKDGLREVLKDQDRIFIGMGPEKGLHTGIEAEDDENSGRPVLQSMPAGGAEISEMEALFKCIGMFWLAGKRVDWNKFYSGERRCRIPLPTYPFERQRYWIEPGKRENRAEQPGIVLSKKEDITEELINSGYKHGTIKLTLDLDSQSRGNDEYKKRLEDILLFKERLEELTREFSGIGPKIEVSDVNLNEGMTEGSSGFGGDIKLKKRPRPELDIPYAAPRNDAEKIIVEKWQDVLGYDCIGVNDDFFELGGHSLIAASVAAELSKVFDIQIPMRQLFETTTVAGIAELIEVYRWAAVSAAESAAGKEDIESGTI